MRKQEVGFTLIEMVFVIVIVSVLSAVAIPKFSDTSGAARKAVLHNTASTIRASAHYVRGLYLMKREKNGYVDLLGEEVAVIRGYPVPSGIIYAAGVEEFEFYVNEEYARIYVPGTVDIENCSIVYRSPKTDGFLTIPPVVEIADVGC
jgi:prepilin-type N-terminal cleavage/methylation domain-containing protein